MKVSHDYGYFRLSATSRDGQSSFDIYIFPNYFVLKLIAYRKKTASMASAASDSTRCCERSGIYS